MQPEKYSPKERKLLTVMAFSFVGLGLSALLRDGAITPAFWILGIAANLAGVQAVFGKKWSMRWLGGRSVNPAKGAFVLLMFALLFRTGPFERMIALDIGDGETLLLRGALLVGADRNAVTGPMRKTLLGEAIDRKQRESAWILLEAGADPNRADVHGWTPLMIARYRDDKSVVALLTQYGATDRPLPVLPKKR